MRRTIYLARHGETSWNLAGRWQGWTDVPLNATGEAQALVLADRLREHGVARIVASSLSRARQTAEIVARVLAIASVGLDPDLRERGFGLFEGLTREECESQHPDHWKSYTADAALPPGAEPYDQVTERMCRAVKRAVDLGEGTLLVVTHGSALRAFVRAVAGAMSAPLPNGALVRATAVGDAFVDAELII